MNTYSLRREKEIATLATLTAIQTRDKRIRTVGELLSNKKPSQKMLPVEMRAKFMDMISKE